MSAAQQPPEEKEDPIIPGLRPDLEIFSGPRDPDGAPTYSIFDPVTGTYHKIGWAEASIVEQIKYPIKLSHLYERIKQTTSLDLTLEDVGGFCRQLIFSGLTTADSVKNVNDLINEKENKKSVF